MENKIDIDQTAEPTDLIVEEPADQHPRQEKINLVIDLGEGFIDVETRSKLQGDSFYRHYGHALTFSLPNGTDASALRKWVDENILPLAEELQSIYESHWDGNNHVATYTDEDKANDITTQISDLCTEDNVPCLSGHAGLWDVEEWLLPVKSDLTNEVKDMSDTDIRDKAFDLSMEAKAEGVIFDGNVTSYLKRLREKAKAQEDEVV